MKNDLSVMYMIRSVLASVKEEMDKKHLSFDEFLEYYDEALAVLENSCRA